MVSLQRAGINEQVFSDLVSLFVDELIGFYLINFPGLIRENERYLLDRVEPIAANTTPRPLLPIDCNRLHNKEKKQGHNNRSMCYCGSIKLGMLLLARDCATENRYPDKGNYVKLLDFILGFKKSCGNTIKVRFDHKYYFYSS
jgi:hypothetical protein